MSETDNPAQDNLTAFLSLPSLKAAHADLLKRSQSNEITSRFIIEVDAFVRSGQAMGALLDADDDRWTAQNLLDYWVTVLYRAGHQPPDATLAEFDRRLAPKLDDAKCPYRGLNAFQVEDHELFFGRKRLIERLIEKLDNDRLIALVGPSGSGKSSLVMAGLIPKLQAGEMDNSRNWKYFPPIVPGSDPLLSLVRLVNNAKTDVPQWQPATADDFQNPTFLTALMGDLGDVPAVLIVDQFEELFTLCGDKKSRQAFADNLLNLVLDSTVRHTVIITMRSDYEMHMSRLPALQANFERAQVRVTPLTAGELREAIEQPAATVGLRFEDGIVDALVEDLLGEPAGLPLLQFTLLKLWDYREHNWVTWNAYQRLGGGRLALATCADSFYENLIPENQQTAKRILLRLVQPGEATEFTRNRIRREALTQLGEDPSRIKLVLGELIQARLVRLTKGVRSADDQVEVAHEALVRNWPTLVNWLEEERVYLRRRMRVSRDAEEWNTKNKDSSLLYRGSRLDDALRDVRQEDLNALESEFIQAGKNLRERERAEKEALRQRELDAERRRRRLLSWGLAVLSVLFVAACILAVLSYFLSQSAQTAESRARATTLALRAIDQLKNYGQDERAALMAQQAFVFAKEERIAEVDDALRTVLSAPYFSHILQCDKKQAFEVTFSPDKKTLAAAIDDTCLRLWDLRDPRSPHSRPCDINREALMNLVVFSPDGETIASAGADGSVRIWYSQNLDAPPEVIKMCSGPINTVAFSPGGDFLVTAGTDKSVRILNLADFKVDPNHNYDGSSIALSVAFSPVGATLATAWRDGHLRLWNFPDLEEPPEDVSAHEGEINSIAFSPDGKILASGGDDKTVRLWNVRNLADPPRVLRGHEGPITSVAFSLDGNTLASASWDQTLRLWHLHDSDVPLTVLRGHKAPINSVAFAPDGAFLASASSDQTVRLWDLREGPARPIALKSHEGGVNSVIFIADETIIAISGQNNRLFRWNLVKRSYQEIQKDSQAIKRVAFSPKSNLLAAAVDDGSIKIWNYQNLNRPLKVVKEDSSTVYSIAFSTDGNNLAWAGSARGSGALRLLDLRKEDEPEKVTAKKDAPSINAIAFSIDGGALAYGDEEGNVRLLNLQNSDKTEKMLGKHDGPVQAVVFSHDGLYLASTGSDGTIRLWSLRDPEKDPRVIGVRTGINSVAFSRNGISLAAAGEDGTVRVFDLRDPIAQTILLRGHEGPVLSVAFSPDGSKIVSGGDDGKILVWIAQSELLSDILCKKVFRDLTENEWRDFVDRNLPYTHACSRFAQ